MADKQRNTWAAKIRRTLTSMLPVSPQRRGQCINCGACCRLPIVCPFLKTNGDGKGYCGIYPFRPLNCRKYPRTDAEHITKDTCGFHFEWQAVESDVDAFTHVGLGCDDWLGARRVSPETPYEQESLHGAG